MKSMKEKQSAFLYEPQMFVSKLNLYDESRVSMFMFEWYLPRPHSEFILLQYRNA